MSRRLDWHRDKADWPLAEYSRFIEAGGLRWHVQRLGPLDASSKKAADKAPPVMLLIHGTGASTHSWRDLAPLLARHAEVIALDLPGHAFTQCPPPNGLSLIGMAVRVRQLLSALDCQPDIVIGHSAGAAILLQLCLDKAIAPRALISLNGALLPFRGLAGRTFPSVAKLLFLNPLVPRLFALGAAREARVQRLIRNTGSSLDDRGLALYARLFASPPHARAALGMMARWDLDTLAERMPTIQTPLWLIVGDNDRAIPPSEADQAARRLPHATIEHLAGVGHLAHEEIPAEVAHLIERIVGETCSERVA